MSNVINAYDPLWYAQESLIQLEKVLGMAARVHRGYDKEPTQLGSTIKIRRPGTFVAQNVGTNDTQDLKPELVDIVVDQWKGVRFALTDKDLAATGDAIINDHIRPAAVAIADAIDQDLCKLADDIPWYIDVGATAGIADLTAARKIMFDNKVPLTDAAKLHFMLDGDMEADLLGQSAFTQFNGGGADAVAAQQDAVIGRRFGFWLFANQNVQSHTKGTASTGTLALTADFTKGATIIGVDAGSVTGTLVKGDSFVIAGNTQRYVVTGTSTAAGNIFSAVQIFPPLVQDYPNNAVVTVSLDDHSEAMAFHSNAFALAMAPLSDRAADLGARVATVSDPITNLSLRSSIWWDGNASSINVRIDALWGVKTLDPNLAVRARN